ncbi:MAG: hypothetical protein HOK36_11990 [Rhodospirillales bacterium]|jgi:hypothetical protein|nr:hypothetical protein [Rhodospirillales bacterium]
MTDNPNGTTPELDDEDGHIHPIQALLDNPFLLLFIGVAMPAVLYTIWGVMELAMIPIAQ